MVLSSQNARPVARRSHMYRRSRKPVSLGAVMTVAVVVGVIGASGYAVWSTVAGDSREVAAADPQPAVDEPEVAEPAGEQGDARTATTPQGGASMRSAGPVSEPAQDPTPQPPQSNQPEITMGGGLVPSGDSGSSDEPQQPAEPDRDDNDDAASDNREGDGSNGEHQSSASGNRQAASEPPRSDVSDSARERARQRLETGMSQKASNRPVDARQTLTAALTSRTLSPTDERKARRTLKEINETLVFGREVVANDPFSRTYTVQSGDTLQRIVNRENLDVDWRFIQRINGLSDPNRIQVGQRLKVVTGPFHAVVDKDAFRLDLYLGEGSERVFVRSYDVGLGEFDSTPEGRFIIERNSKLIDPAWTNPRTREYYEPGDPENPIGNRWLGMRGLDREIRDLQGYGIHGTIEPESIGEMRSMGCIRIRPGEVEVVYEMLTEETSHVHVIRNRSTEFDLP